MEPTRFEVINGDVLTTPCDVLVLKFAQAFYGADREVADALEVDGFRFGVVPGDHLLLPTAGKLACKHVLFLGVPSLWDFGYAEIRSFARRALSVLAATDVERGSVGLTVHGVGYGLDEREAFTAEMAGLLEYLSRPESSWLPRQVVIVEREPNRSQRVRGLLQTILSESGYGKTGPKDATPEPRLPDAGIASAAKKHIFVAMPYDDAMEDVYEFGIKEAVNEAGCLCERCDRDVFIGDILERIKHRIADSTVVIAELTGSNPNVYLEVGYAWGKGVPTLLIAREGEELKFDVKMHKCIYYKNISHLRRQLSAFMRGLVRG